MAIPFTMQICMSRQFLPTYLNNIFNNFFEFTAEFDRQKINYLGAKVKFSYLTLAPNRLTYTHRHTHTHAHVHTHTHNIFSYSSNIEVIFFNLNLHHGYIGA